MLSPRRVACPLEAETCERAREQDRTRINSIKTDRMQPRSASPSTEKRGAWKQGRLIDLPEFAWPREINRAIALIICRRRGSSDATVHQQRPGGLEGAEAVRERRPAAAAEQQSPPQQSAAVASGSRFRWQEEPADAAAALAAGVLPGQCQGRRLLRRLAEQGEHAGKCCEPPRGRSADESSSRDERRVDDGFESQQTQRKGPHRPAHSVLREPVRAQGKAQQHGEDTGAVLERAERKVGNRWAYSQFLKSNFMSILIDFNRKCKQRSDCVYGAFFFSPLISASWSHARAMLPVSATLTLIYTA